MMPEDPEIPLRIGNASGFYGDRFAAVREMLADGPLDVLTGDYLAELTMALLAVNRLKDPAYGYARTFLRQMEDCLGLAVERGVSIVTNAGGLNPGALAFRLRELAARLCVDARVAWVEGDDVLGRADLGLPPSLLAANAYLGAFGIAEALRAGADVVVTGRVTDASLVVGPAAAHFGWTRDELDRLAGATVAGHILECGAQATGGNFSFFTEIDARHPGFPLAEVYADGRCVVTKHPDTGGAVTVETVTAQLLYETDGARYAGPDVTTRLDGIRLHQQGPDRVLIDGAVGEPPPPTLKVGINRQGGFRNEVVFVLTGLDIEEKAALVREQMDAAFGERRPAEVRWSLARTDHADAAVEEEASAMLRLVVRDVDAHTVGRAVSDAAVQLALAGYPGFHLTAPPADASPYGVFEAVYIGASRVGHVAITADDRRVEIHTPTVTLPLEPVAEPELPAPLPPGPTRRAPLGRVVGARSGDKGGDANIGLWARSDEGWCWLAHTLTVEQFRQLLPEVATLAVTRHLLPNLRAVNFVVHGLLGQGVGAQARFDPQAKAVGEWLRSRYLDIPELLLEQRP
ncbi:acyclic terpene utilization AtuA family protein [Actinospica robiniae]|uniref:acyclic terpene utilization AtuA family protein n=1 Tax=Actinospica robiniae TaxID=304901 RepID=UPI00040F6BCB|nr:acyclic terpene utilization AtuA family protein [Actinospica robiniae]